VCGVCVCDRNDGRSSLTALARTSPTSFASDCDRSGRTPVNCHATGVVDIMDGIQIESVYERAQYVVGCVRIGMKDDDHGYPG
jgi:hypothetical protein